MFNLERPAVFPEINAASKAVIGDFGSTNESILGLIFGQFNPEGKLPFELPCAMAVVEAQKEDEPYDSKDPLHRFAYGLTYYMKAIFIARSRWNDSDSFRLLRTKIIRILYS